MSDFSTEFNKHWQAGTCSTKARACKRSTRHWAPSEFQNAMQTVGSSVSSNTLTNWCKAATVPKPGKINGILDVFFDPGDEQGCHMRRLWEAANDQRGVGSEEDNWDIKPTGPGPLADLGIEHPQKGNQGYRVTGHLVINPTDESMMIDGRQEPVAFRIGFRSAILNCKLDGLGGFNSRLDAQHAHLRANSMGWMVEGPIVDGLIDGVCLDNAYLLTVAPEGGEASMSITLTVARGDIRAWMLDDDGERITGPHPSPNKEKLISLLLEKQGRRAAPGGPVIVSQVDLKLETE